MANSSITDNGFLNKLTEMAEANLTNPQFGVSMLAKEMGMSRSNLHRKVNSEQKISVSQFINHVRLKKAKDLLRHTSDTVSEVAYKVGYNNVSYFIKCFHKYYGYSPGHVGDREETEELSNPAEGKKHLRTIFTAATAVALVGVVLILVFKPFQFQQKKLESSIIMLPMDNWETNDSISINGVLESIRDNLCKIREIDMKPPVSVLRSKNSLNSNLEIAQKYKANYLIQPKTWRPPGKENIYLALDIIEVQGNTHLNNLNHEINSNNITTIHQSFVEGIIDKLDISITPAEQGRIDKVITSNKKAYDYYWEGMDYLNRTNALKADQEKAMDSFKKVLKIDENCAEAYAMIAYIYYLMDVKWYDSKYSNDHNLYDTEIGMYADQAYRINPQLDLSCIAKGVYWRNKNEYKLAIVFFEDAAKYNPSSMYIKNQLFTLYRLVESREKYIELALKFINAPDLYLESNEYDIGIEVIYTELSRNYRFLGFFKEAEHYINEALRVNPYYTFAYNIKSQIILDMEAKDNYEKSIRILNTAFEKDSVAPIIFRRVAQSYYMLKDYKKAIKYYKKHMELTGKNWTDGFDIQSKRIAVILRNMGEAEKAQIQINNYRIFAEQLSPGMKNFHLSGYYAFLGDTTKAFECLKESSKYDQLYHRLRQLRDDPVYDDIRELPQFQEILANMENRFNERRDSIKIVFKKKGLLKIEL